MRRIRMSFELFAQEIKVAVEKKTGKAVRVETTHKNNVVLTGITMLGENDSISPVFYLEPFYEKLEEGVFGSTDEIAEVIVRSYEEAPKILDQETLVKKMQSPEYIMENVIPCLMGRNDNNVDFFEQYLGRDFLDMRIVYRVVVSELLAGERGTFVLSKQLCEQLRLTEEEIYDAAIKNAGVEFTAKSLSSILFKFFEDEDGVPDLAEDELPFWVVSNKTQIHGAASFLCEDRIKDFLNKKEIEEAVVLPSSIHEVLIAEYNPSDMSIDGFKSMVESVNATEVSPEEQLTDSVYIYNIHTGYRIAS